MNKNYMVPVTILIAITVFGCMTPPTVSVNSNLDRVISEACFEVVQLRVESERITYARELPWNTVPSHIRNDEYYSIGTAFAAAPDRFITAAHVFDITRNSPLYSDYYIRDSRGDVYAVTDILRFHDSDEDFVEFAVEGFQASSYLEMRNEPYRKNETVYQVGNIYGEGIVAVPGTVLGERPESGGGSWNFIKSSPANDRGSSGGPLVDEEMRVIGVICYKDDNFSYSLPVDVIRNSPAGKGFVEYIDQNPYFFDLLQGESGNPLPYRQELDLPMNIKDVKSVLSEKYYVNYQERMDDFFSNAGGLFPDAEGSETALYNIPSSPDGIQVVARSEGDKKWYFSNLDKDWERLEGEGFVYYSYVNNFIYFDIAKPPEMAYDELVGSPRSVMDTFLSGLSYTREFSDEEIRVTSLGEPFRSKALTDRYGRKWSLDAWTVDYIDYACIMMWIPVPSGVAGVMNFVDSSDMNLWMYDLERIADLTYVPYAATLEEWREYLKHPESASGPYADMELDFRIEDKISIDSPEFTLSFDSSFFEVDEKMIIWLIRDFYSNGDDVVWGLRDIMISEEGWGGSVRLTKLFKPSGDLPRAFHQRWEDVQELDHPYNSRTYQLEGYTNISTVHPQSNQELALLMTVDLEGDHPQELMTERLEFFKKALVLK